MASGTSLGAGSDPVEGSMVLYVQGHQIDLLYGALVRPTLFSLLLANTIEAGERTQLAYDLGTGGGILAIALARLGVERVVAIDRSPAACEIAEENVRRNGVAAQVEIVHGDIAETKLAGGAERIVVNPPTMPDRPAVPFYADGGGEDGRDFLRTLFHGLPSWLARSGRAQIVLSSLITQTEEFQVLGRGFSLSPMATIVAPFRAFYGGAYGADAVHHFVGAGQALSGGGGPPGVDLSELITVYMLERSPTP